MSIAQASVAAQRIQFFDYLFGDEEGQLCIAVGNADKTYFREYWFKWPSERVDLQTFLEVHNKKKQNVWFGVSLFTRPTRGRENAVPGTRVWSDLDYVEPFDLSPPPNVIIESSPGRYQAFWTFKDVLPPDVAQDYSRRLAYDIGADKSGWDLEQLLRVPFTKNYKYTTPPDVKLLRVIAPYETQEVFENLPVIEQQSITGPIQLEDAPDIPTDLIAVPDIIKIYQKALTNPLRPQDGQVFIDLVETDPSDLDDWSKRLWRLINLCLELGMTEEQTFSVAAQSKCNKYARDNRPLSHLWREIQKAQRKQRAFMVGATAYKLEMPRMVDPDKVEEDSFVAEYKKWANEATDAPEQYHELSCFIALSSVISQGLALELPYDNNFRPNLWGLLLGESTLSRKTTSMNMAMDLITDLDPELILASDGSAEGMFSAIAARPRKVSIFFKDEVSGFFDSINKKDYLAGFSETLTKLYDVPKILPRVLRKETITVTEPYFIFFGGGIRDKVHGLINDDYILSGFIPRFLVVSSENDIDRLRRTGPPTSLGTSKKDALTSRLADLKEQYTLQVPAKVGSQSFFIDGRIDAYLTPQAWDFFGDLEETVPLSAVDTPWEMLALPTFTRLVFSVLKMSMLIAATRREPTDSHKLEVQLSDLQQAAFYVQKWGKYSLELIMASGKSKGEKIMDQALHFIALNQNGVTQAELMRRFHIASPDMRVIRDTLHDRGLIDLTAKGRGYLMKAVKF